MNVWLGAARAAVAAIPATALLPPERGRLGFAPRSPLTRSVASDIAMSCLDAVIIPAWNDRNIEAIFITSSRRVHPFEQRKKTLQHGRWSRGTA